MMMFGNIFGLVLGPFLSRLLGISQPVAPPVRVGNQTISPEYVEQLIMSVGRQRVFNRAKELGWSPNGETPPLWVWYQICCELINAGAVDTGFGNQPLN
jgi:hypothetical protein